MCMGIYVNMYVHNYTYVFIHICMYEGGHVYIPKIHAHIHVYVCIYMHASSRHR